VCLLLPAAGFLLYSILALALIIYLIFWVAPEHGTENVLVYLAICSLAGSFTVTSCKVSKLCHAVVQQKLYCTEVPAISGPALPLRTVVPCCCAQSRGLLCATCFETAVSYCHNSCVTSCRAACAIFTGSWCSFEVDVPGPEPARLHPLLRLPSGELVLRKQCTCTVQAHADLQTVQRHALGEGLHMRQLCLTDCQALVQHDPRSVHSVVCCRGGAGAMPC
jgi:hypothetical protein